MSRTFWGGEEPVSMSTQAPPPKAFMEHSQTCPNKSPPDVVAVMTQSSSKVVTGQITHDKIYYGQMIKLQKSE